MEIKNNEATNIEIKLTQEQLYAKYCLIAKIILNKESLEKKQKKLFRWLFVLLIVIILITLLIYFFMSGFNFQAFRELTDGNLGYWTVAGLVFLCLIFILIIATRKHDFVEIGDYFKKAEDLIKEKNKEEDSMIAKIMIILDKEKLNKP